MQKAARGLLKTTNKIHGLCWFADNCHQPSMLFGNAKSQELRGISTGAPLLPLYTNSHQEETFILYLEAIRRLHRACVRSRA